MMSSTRRSIAVIVAVLCASAAFGASVDFGGNLFNSSGYGNYPTINVSPAGSGLTQNDVGNLWFQAALSDSILFSLQLGAAYNLTPLPTPPVTKLFVDADVASLQGTFTAPQAGLSLFRFTLGRTTFTDFTGLVLNHKADGFSLGFDYPALSVDVSAAYTGLVNKGASTITVSKADASDSTSAGVYFAPPRLIQSIQVVFPSLAGQELSLGSIFQEDMRGTPLDLTGTKGLVSVGQTTFNPGQGGPVNTQYYGVGVDGMVVSALYYKVYSYFQVTQDVTYSQTAGAYQPAQSYGLLAGGEVHYYMPKVFFSAIGSRLLYVSGDASATSVYEGNASTGLSNFTPISRGTLDYVFSPFLTNVFVGEASYSLKPLAWMGGDFAESVQTAVKADVYARATTGAISEPGILSGNSEAYLGTEADLTVNFRPFSDVGVTAWGGVFFPGAAFGTSAATQFKAGLDVSLSF